MKLKLNFAKWMFAPLGVLLFFTACSSGKLDPITDYGCALRELTFRAEEGQAKNTVTSHLARAGRYDLLISHPDEPGVPKVWNGELVVKNNAAEEVCRISVRDTETFYYLPKRHTIVFKSDGLQFFSLQNCEKETAPEGTDSRAEVFADHVRVHSVCQPPAASETLYSCKAARVYSLGEYCEFNLDPHRSAELTQSELGVKFTGEQKIGLSVAHDSASSDRSPAKTP